MIEYQIVITAKMSGKQPQKTKLSEAPTWRASRIIDGRRGKHSFFEYAIHDIGPRRERFLIKVNSPRGTRPFKRGAFSDVVCNHNITHLSWRPICLIRMSNLFSMEYPCR